MLACSVGSVHSATVALLQLVMATAMVSVKCYRGRGRCCLPTEACKGGEVSLIAESVALSDNLLPGP